MSYVEHLRANMEVARRCAEMMLWHALHGLIRCKYTSHEYWGK